MQFDTTMSETKARREARRRRILENSESRLRKITGKNNPDEAEDNPIESNNVKASSNVEKHNLRNGTCSINNEENLQDYTRFNNDEHKRLLNDTNDEHERLLNNTSDKNTHLSEQISNVELMLYTLLANRVNLILLAGIVNILLVLELDYWFGKTIIIPYSLLMLGRIYSYLKLYGAQDGNLLVAALILCNIKPKLIHRLKVLITLFNLILTDFDEISLLGTLYDVFAVTCATGDMCHAFIHQ